MRAVAILVLFMTAYASASPLLGLDLNLGLDLSLGGIYNGLKHIVNGVVSWLSSGLAVAGNVLVKNTFLEQLKNDIHAKLQAGGEISADLLASVISHTLGLATGNNILSADFAASIGVTFNIPGIAGGVKLTADAIDQLVVGGDAAAAAVFKTAIKLVLDAQANGAARLNLLAGVEHACVDLLTANAVIKYQGAFDLKNYFNLSNLKNGLEAVVGGSLNYVNQVIANLQGVVGGNVQAAQSFLANLKVQLEAKAQAGGKLSLGLLAKVATSTLNLAVGNSLCSNDIALRLLATFAPNLGSNALPIKLADIDALVIGGDAVAAGQFRLTLKALLELQANGGEALVVLGGFESAVLNLVSANAVLNADALLNIKTSLGALVLTPVFDLIGRASQLFNDLSAKVAGNAAAASKFLVDIKGFIQAKVKAGGQLTVDVVAKVVGAVLQLATSNKVLSLDVAARVAISFGVDIGADAKPLSVNDVDSLTIGGDVKAAAQFRATLKALLQVKIDAGVGATVSSVSGLLAALFDLLSANGVIQASAALGLKGYFSA